MRKSKALAEADAEVLALRRGLITEPSKPRCSNENVFDPATLTLVGRSGKAEAAHKDVQEYLRHVVREWRSWELEDHDFNEPFLDEMNTTKHYPCPPTDPFATTAKLKIGNNSAHRISEATVFQTVFERGATVEKLLEKRESATTRRTSKPTSNDLYNAGSALSNSSRQQSKDRASKGSIGEVKLILDHGPPCTSKIVSSGRIVFCSNCSACQTGPTVTCAKCGHQLQSASKQLIPTENEINEIAALEAEEQRAFREAIMEWRNGGKTNEQTEEQQFESDRPSTSVGTDSALPRTLKLPSGCTYFTKMVAAMQS